ncbi:hypothetical protein C2G38_1198219 [Gigaspora rosea]|uniref:Uncharacterized protein n=1 Tax=Gigaspora rosea TaxID=44941 RepID=A0A397W7D8_9GLOM|nr:hypothetical protein C2G38_1198219 [Gigaspora rosea]
MLIKHILFNEKKDIDGHEKRMLRIDHINSEIFNSEIFNSEIFNSEIFNSEIFNSEINKQNKQNKHQLPEDLKPDRDSLLHEKSLHMPQYVSWECEENTIRKAFNKAFRKEGKENTFCKALHEVFHKAFHKASTDSDDPIYLEYLLEYYCNKAVEDTGWMISVGEILPELYETSHDPKNSNEGFVKSFIHIIIL